jgi:hypothetical protein
MVLSRQSEHGPSRYCTTVLARLLLAGVFVHTAGCGEPRPALLYSSYQEVHVGKRFPSELRMPGQMERHEAESAMTVQRSGQWTFGRFAEHATFLVDAEEVVVGKRYVRACAEAFFAFSWQYERGILECELVASPSTSPDEVVSRCEALDRLDPGFWPRLDVDTLKNMLGAATKSPKWSSEGFTWSGVTPTKQDQVHGFRLVSPVAWHIRRVAPDVLRIRSEERSDVCPVVATPLAWVTAPFWLPWVRF